VSPTFRALNSYNYRLWLTGSMVSNIGTWMQRVAQDWLVLTILTHHSAEAVGITTGLQFLPMLLLAPYGGLIADRVPKRLLLMGTQLLMGLLALGLGVLVVTGVVQLWMVYGFALALGAATALDNPARQTFVSEMVPREHLSNAVGLNSATFNAGRLIGPGIAGLLIAWVGTGPVFMINAASFAAVLISLTRMRTRELRVTPVTPRAKGQLRDGFRYVWHRPDIMLILVIVFAVGTFGLNFQMTTAFMATTVFHKGADAARRRCGAGVRGVRLHQRDDAHLPALRDHARPGRALRADHDHQRERHRADERRARPAGPGDGAVHGDLHGRYADRLTHRGLGRRGVGRALVDPHGRPGHDRDRAGRARLARAHPPRADQHRPDRGPAPAGSPA
jgi:hypothetical protein